MATALAATASYLLVRALQAAASGTGAAGWLTGYAACLAALGYMHPFGLLLVAAHAVLVARVWLRRGTVGRSLALGWLAAVAGALALVSPLIAVSKAQRVVLTWARTPAIRAIAGLTSLVGPRWMAAAAGLAVLCGIAVSAVAGRARLRASWPGDLLALCLAWLILPAAILISVSLITPVYVFRYVMFCAPAAALLVGTALAALGWRAGAAGLAIIAVMAVPAQLRARSPGGHSDDIRAADQIVAQNLRPGDVMLYQSIGEPIEAAYPYGLGQLRNIKLAQTPARSGTLGGTYAGPRMVRRRLAGASRVWVVQLSSSRLRAPGQPPALLRKRDFGRIRIWHTTGVWLSLYARQRPG